MSCRTLDRPVHDHIKTIIQTQPTNADQVMSIYGASGGTGPSRPRSFAVCSILVIAALLLTPVRAARIASLGGHQTTPDGVEVVTSLRHGQASVGQSRGHRSSGTGNRHEQHSPAHHPLSAYSSSSSAAALERYVDERIEKLEARFNQRLDEQSRKLNQTIAIQYIERVIDSISEELQNNQELMISAAERNSGSSDQNDSTGTTTAELSHEVDRQRGELARIKESLSQLQSSLDRLANVVSSRQFVSSTASAGGGAGAGVTPAEYKEPTSKPTIAYPIDCQDAYDQAILLRADGFQYTLIQPRGVRGPFRVCCYVNNTSSWTVIQRRLNGSVDFYRNWDEYKGGFGFPEAEFWFGNERIYKLTSQGNYRLRVEMVTWDDNPHSAEYQYFRLSPETDRYRLHVSGYVLESDAGDSLTSAWENDHNGQPFSTYDSDNDARFYDNCAQHYRGAWWFRSCFQSHLNGVYYHRGLHSNFFVRNGIQWNTIHPHSSLRYVAMMVRRHNNEDISTSPAGAKNN